MEDGMRYRIMGIILLIVLAVVDAFLVFVPIVAILGLIILLFKPKWFYNIIVKMYE